jgi:hypothetical protein
MKKRHDELNPCAQISLPGAGEDQRRLRLLYVVEVPE